MDATGEVFGSIAQLFCKQCAPPTAIQSGDLSSYVDDLSPGPDTEGPGHSKGDGEGYPWFN